MASREQIRTLVGKLATIFNTPPNMEATVDGWMFVLEGCNDRELLRAVEEYMRSDERYFPKPGQILKNVQATRSKTWGQETQQSKDWNQLQEGPCPVCGAVLQLYADPHASKYVYNPRKGEWRPRTADDPEVTKRYQVVHDRVAHERAGVPAVGYAR